MVQQKMNIGNYKSALDTLPPSMQAGVGGLKAMLAAARAFIANPIGAVIAAIAGAGATACKKH